MRSWHCHALLLTALLPTFTQAADFTLVSPDLSPHDTFGAEYVYNGFGCNGNNHSPALHWSGAPTDTRSFAITMYDPDAPSGSGWWHWLVVNLPASVSALSSDASAESLPAGALQTRTDFGKPGYGGPCPPQGKAHRYEFTVWALKTDKLAVDAEASGALVGFMIRQNALAHAKLTVKYAR
ncbi:YbhB/YbcL family Raf kinase inhibitor-like protein [Lysobacter sp. CA196]|uniref:YbhB/YbcL family Raf kinase inhibitor-like protein n=1 Tax=Lysobacter sp. CA196 TaxID=3455606 RepID=UPI003F8D1934